MQTKFKLVSLTAALPALPASAQDQLEIIGQPIDGKLGFQPAATDLAKGIQDLDLGVLIVVTLITLFVTGLLIYAVVRFNQKSNPNPASFTHNTKVEVAWTIVPIIILLGIVVFSLPELFRQQEIPEGDVNIKVTGNQWYWGYEYVDHGFEFDSNLIGSPATLDEDVRPEDANIRPYVLDANMEAKLAEAGYDRNQWLLATDTVVVVPVDKTIVMTITGADVIHSWTIPAFGVKQDAVPGRLAQLWFKPNKEGIYFGQCSELCGKDHAYMPITVKVVSQEAYEKWLNGAIEEYAGIPTSYTIAAK
jgi:cytochrome c oxidase subunit 2